LGETARPAPGTNAKGKGQQGLRRLKKTKGSGKVKRWNFTGGQRAWGSRNILRKPAWKKGKMNPRHWKKKHELPLQGVANWRFTTVGYAAGSLLRNPVGKAELYQTCGAEQRAKEGRKTSPCARSIKKLSQEKRGIRKKKLFCGGCGRRRKKNKNKFTQGNVGGLWRVFSVGEHQFIK